MEKTPPNINLEITNSCNLECKMCFRQYSKYPIGFMANSLFKKVVDEIAGYKSPTILRIHWRGEPLLHPHCFEFLAYCKNKGVKVFLLTNATLLDENNLRLLEKNLPYEVCFSLESIDKKAYEDIRRGADFGRVFSNIEKAIEIAKRGGARTRINVVSMPENRQSIPLIIEEYGKKVDRINVCSVNSFTDRSSALGEKAEINHKGRACKYLADHLMIGWDGKAYPCLYCINGEYELGDVNNQTIESIWNSVGLKEIKERQLKQFDKGTKFCAGCEWSRHK